MVSRRHIRQQYATALAMGEPFNSSHEGRPLVAERSRRGTAIRILAYGGQGFSLAQKQLSQGRFHWWPEGRSAGALRGGSKETVGTIFRPLRGL